MTMAEIHTDTAAVAPTAAQLAFGRYQGGEAIRTDDPNAALKLTAKIKLLTDTRQAMKDINAALRLKAVVTGNEKLRALGLSDDNIAVARGKGGKMFPAWELQNLGQNIARLEKRLDQIKAEADRAPAEDVEGDGYRLVENTEMCRIQILFEAKPDAETRAILKRNGFRWAPSQDAWQRHLNENGRYAAKRALASIAAA